MFGDTLRGRSRSRGVMALIILLGGFLKRRPIRRLRRPPPCRCPRPVPPNKRSALWPVVRPSGGTSFWSCSVAAAWARSTRLMIRSWTARWRSSCCGSTRRRRVEAEGRHARCARPRRSRACRTPTSSSSTTSARSRTGCSSRWSSSRGTRPPLVQARAQLARDSGGVHGGRARAGGGARDGARPPRLQARQRHGRRDGQVRVMDFGLARQSTRRPRHAVAERVDSPTRNGGRHDAEPEDTPTVAEHGPGTIDSSSTIVIGLPPGGAVMVAGGDAVAPRGCSRCS